MMIEELEIIPEESEMSAWKSGVVTFVSFFILGGIPVLPYLFSWSKWNDTPPAFQSGTLRYAEMQCLTPPADKVFWIATAIFLITLFALGAYKVLVNHRSYNQFVSLVSNSTLSSSTPSLAPLLLAHHSSRRTLQERDGG